MAERLKIDNDVHELKLGKSFDSRSKVAFHSIRYDFKPESLDSTKSSTVTVKDNNSVTVSVPHVQSSGTSHTVYKGNKRPVQKECVLVIDHDSGEFTLEKLSNAIQLKKTRSSVTEKVPGAGVSENAKIGQGTRLMMQRKPRAALPSNQCPCIGNHGNQWLPGNQVVEVVDSDEENDENLLPCNRVSIAAQGNQGAESRDKDIMTSHLSDVEHDNEEMCGFMTKLEAEESPGHVRSRRFRIFRLRSNVETTSPVAMETYDDSDDSLPDLPDITEVLRKERFKKFPITKFAKQRRPEINNFLANYKLDTQRRPCVRSLGHMTRFEEKHPDIFARMKARLEIPDADLFALNNYLCDEYCEALRGNGPAFLMMQKLEDIVDFIIKLYNEQ